jgi:hypothetical protein
MAENRSIEEALKHSKGLRDRLTPLRSEADMRTLAEPWKANPWDNEVPVGGEVDLLAWDIYVRGGLPRYGIFKRFRASNDDDFGGWRRVS